MKIKKEKEHGSVLVLTIIAVLILSIMVTGLLNVGTTEIYTTQNYHLNKAAYYTAVQGVEDIRNLIYNNPDPEVIKNYYKDPPAEAYSDSDDYLSYYTTGTLKDLEQMGLSGNEGGIGGGTTTPDTPKIGEFIGFTAPLPPSISLGSGTTANFKPVVWKVQVTSTVRVNNRPTYSEIIAGIYTLVEI